MLFRVAGRVGPKDTDRFTSRVEAGSVIGAISTVRNSLNEQGVADEKIAEIRARGVEGGSSIRFSKPKDPNAPKRTRKAKADGAAPSKK